MKTLDSITRQHLKNEYNLTEAFIKRHGREMGGIGKPMIWDREQVELFLRERMWAERLKKEEMDERARAMKDGIDRIIWSARKAVAVDAREIIGRGGRGRA